MAIRSNTFATTGRSRKGEPWVWLTASGLSIGVVLTVALLLLIIFKGLSSFWPARIDVLEIKTGDSVEKVAGIITQARSRKDVDGSFHKEIQLFRGNRSLTPELFLFIDEAKISSTERPADMCLIEQLEGGKAIGRLRSFTESGNAPVDATSQEFQKVLKNALREGSRTRKQLRKIERDEIGEVNKGLEQLRILEKTQPGDSGTASRRADLEARYLTLAADARTLRERLSTRHLVVEAADGRTMEIATGNILHVFESNRAGFFSRLWETLHRIWNFLSDEPREANTEGGAFPAIFGTVTMTLVMCLFVTPFGVITAIYLREYAKQGFLVRAVRISVNNLAGVPSIVFGVFGLAFFVYFLGGEIDSLFFPDKGAATYKTGGMLWASLTLALMTVPVVIVATEEALAAVPRGVREAALACGASKWQVIQRVVLPASLPGILTGIILAMARGAGEVAPLMLVGVVKLAPELPIDGSFPFVHPERKFMHLGFHIYDLGFQSPDSEAAKPMVFATTLLLIVLVVAMNLTAIILRNRIRKRYAVSSF
ncbi:MAG: phosphate ABC transporter permease PstA [Akkermansiaceae bacterium]|nr:phosphate ABC transporter permease PstA [Akkermansiaceae bacterium]